MTIQTNIQQINQSFWQDLIANSSMATWFQTPQAYDFFAQQPDLFKPFVVAIPKRAYCVGYITQEHNPIKQFLTRRAIIIGGPALADDCMEEEVKTILHEVVRLVHKEAIYIETRNFNDYSHWRTAFEQCGFDYQPHLNFHVDTSSIDIVEQNIGKNRKRDIKTSFRDGATIIENPTMEQVRSYYTILKRLYTTKVKTPLFPLSFFEHIYNHPDGHIILVALNGDIIGGTVCMSLDNKCLYEWFVSGRDGEWKSIFPSSVATYAGIKYATEHNMPRFDMMGAGTPNEAYGVRDFKARFGGNEVEYGRYVYHCKPLLYSLGKMGVQIMKKI